MEAAVQKHIGASNTDFNAPEGAIKSSQSLLFNEIQY